MKASTCSFEQMRSAAQKLPKLALLTSFIQVEEGLSELQAHWDGFVEVSDDYRVTFKSRKQIYNDFATILSEFVDYAESLA